MFRRVRESSISDRRETRMARGSYLAAMSPIGRGDPLIRFVSSYFTVADDVRFSFPFGREFEWTRWVIRKPSSLEVVAENGGPQPVVGRISEQLLCCRSKLNFHLHLPQVSSAVKLLKSGERGRAHDCHAAQGQSV